MDNEKVVTQKSRSTRARQPLTLALVVGATLFGMVLAGGFDLTPSGFAQEGESTMVQVEPVAGLPSFADLAEPLVRLFPALADVPDRDTLNAMLLGAISGPARSLASLVAAPGGAMARVLQARVDAGGGAED